MRAFQALGALTRLKALGGSSGVRRMGVSSAAAALKARTVNVKTRTPIGIDVGSRWDPAHLTQL